MQSRIQQFKRISESIQLNIKSWFTNFSKRLPPLAIFKFWICSFLNLWKPQDGQVLSIFLIFTWIRSFIYYYYYLFILFIFFCITRASWSFRQTLLMDNQNHKFGGEWHLWMKFWSKHPGRDQNSQNKNFFCTKVFPKQPHCWIGPAATFAAFAV